MGKAKSDGHVVDGFDLELEGLDDSVVVKVTQYADGALRFVVPKFGPVEVKELTHTCKQVIIRIQPKGVKAK